VVSSDAPQTHIVPEGRSERRAQGAEQNAGTVPAFFRFTIGGSAPGALRLVLGLGELCAFAVNLGRLWTARFEGIAGVDSRGC